MTSREILFEEQTDSAPLLKWGSIESEYNPPEYLTKTVEQAFSSTQTLAMTLEFDDGTSYRFYVRPPSANTITDEQLAQAFGKDSKND